uniref:Transmembrane domain-containing protein n=1 Tax=Spironucleus salmonicida TaxID=348837 RepID=V6LL32_9EUKA|eukprot:EST41389.1 Transmembrane domain-containing protein [Spironucleus salmonicida]
MRKIDRALILVQQPIYTFVLFKFRVVQLGPYNTTIMLLLYVGVLGITVITGYVTSWLLEDVVFKANIFLMKKQLKLKQDYLIHLALSKTSHKSVES